MVTGSSSPPHGTFALLVDASPSFGVRVLHSRLVIDNLEGVFRC